MVCFKLWSQTYYIFWEKIKKNITISISLYRKRFRLKIDIAKKEF